MSEKRETTIAIPIRDIQPAESPFLSATFDATEAKMKITHTTKITIYVLAITFIFILKKYPHYIMTTKHALKSDMLHLQNAQI